MGSSGSKGDALRLYSASSHSQMEVSSLWELGWPGQGMGRWWIWDASDVGSKSNIDDVAVAWYWIAALVEVREKSLSSKNGRDQIYEVLWSVVGLPV